MNTDQFIAECQGYFGPYTATQKKYVRQWLEQHTESRFPLLFAEVLKTISPVYKTPPGIKDLEDAWKHVAEKFRPELAAPAVAERPMALDWIPVALLATPFAVASTPLAKL
mgnify:CR=1 FL=1